LAQVVELDLQTLDSIENLDHGLVFPLVVLVGDSAITLYPDSTGDILGRLRFSVVALEAELLAGATLWPLFVTFLFTTPTCIAGLEKGRDVRPWWEKGEQLLGQVR
jgi:hypothetical protein